MFHYIQILTLLVGCSLYAAAAPKLELKLKPGEEKDFVIHPKLKMRFCRIPAGQAILGAPDSEKLRTKDQKEHSFTTPGFWLGKFEVMQGEWESVMGMNPCSFAKTGENKMLVANMDTSQFPVESVSWDDCQIFIKKCKLAGFEIRLPHEDEWEYAYRGAKGNKQAFYWGNELNGDKANHRGERPYGTKIKGNTLERSCHVGTYSKQAPHPWGLCDMSGNVAEWCDNLYPGSKYRVFRGGSWSDEGKFCRGAIRFRNTPDDRSKFIGFRLALIPESK